MAADLDIRNDQERGLLLMALKLIRDAKDKRATGKLMLECELNDGNVTNKWANTRYRVRE